MQTQVMTNKYQTLGKRASGKEREEKWRKRKEKLREGKLRTLRRKVRKENGGAGEEG